MPPDWLNLDLVLRWPEPAALALLGLTAALALLPLWPALREWRRPRDVTPLPIDEADALEPDYMARRFIERLAAARAQGAQAIGRAALAELPPGPRWPAGTLTAEEQARRSTRRIWRTDGDAELPEGLDALAEVCASGSLRAAPGCTYRALLVGERLRLCAGARVLRWAHARAIAAEPRCQLHGRISAETALLVAEHVSFALLHAPLIRFAGCLPAGGDEAGLAVIEGLLPAAPGQPARAVASLHVPPLRRHAGDLQARAHLSLGPGCRVEGSLRAGESLLLGAGCVVTGGLDTDGEILLGDACEVHGSLRSGSAVVLGPGAVVGRPGQPVEVHAPVVDIGPGVVVHGRVFEGGRPLQVRPVALPLGPGVNEAGLRWCAHTGRASADGDLRLGAHTHWQGDLVSPGELALGERCVAGGSLKAAGAVQLGSGCRVAGSVVAGGALHLGAGSRVGGSLLSETAIVLGPGSVVGAPGRPATVSAPRLEIGLGVTVHGTVWAGDLGDTQGAFVYVADDPLAAPLPGQVLG